MEKQTNNNTKNFDGKASLRENRLFPTAQLISAFVLAIRIVRFLLYINPKCQAFSHLLWLYSSVCVGFDRKPRRPVFSQRGSNVFAIRIVRFLLYINPKCQAFSHLLWLYSSVCVGFGRKPRRPVFSQRGSNTGCIFFQ